MEKFAYKEKQIHGTLEFPVAVYNEKIFNKNGYIGPLHYHKEFELLICTKGNLKVQIEDEFLELSSGEGVFINSGFLHSIGSDREYCFTAIVFDYTFICTEQDCVFNKYIQPLINNIFDISPKFGVSVFETVNEISNIYSSHYFGCELNIKQLLSGILYQLIKNTNTVSPRITNQKSIVIREVLKFIEENYSKQISLGDLAKFAHISKEYLCRVFSAVAGVSPIEYLNRYRVRQSTYMLVNTSKNISEISCFCGFNNSSYFNKLFLRYIGCTPKQYRIQNTSYKNLI